MATNIINVHVKNIRPKYNNLKERMQDSNNIYIGRKGIVFIDGERFPKKDSIWSNPFKITASQNRVVVLQLYKDYIVKKIRI